MKPLQQLLSLPPAMASWLRGQASDHSWFASCDPVGSKLGSGGGLARLLAEAHLADGAGDFGAWLGERKRLAILAGGQSRRLPAYAATGKIFLPMPIMRWSFGQRLDQSLLDLQSGEYARVLEACPDYGRVLVTSGDVFLGFPEVLPDVPEADVVGFGMAASPELAAGFGVFFTPRDQAATLEFFLQKPDPSRTRELARDFAFYVDSGVWLLSERAVRVLMSRCGWREGDPDSVSFFELYSGFGPSLGRCPAEPDEAMAGLTAAVVPVPQGEFYHFGTTRQMIESVSELQNRAGQEPGQGDFWRKPHPDMYVLNSDFEFRTRSADHSTIWVENCSLPPDLELPGGNVLTGVPAGVGKFALAAGDCVDCVPVQGGWVVRPYGLDDRFAGPVGLAHWLGRPASEWFAARGLRMENCGIDGQADIQECPLFAVVEEPEARWISWLLAARPEASPELAQRWKSAVRHSARELGEVVDLALLLGQRRTLAARASRVFWEHRSSNPFFRVDLESAAALYHESGAPDAEPCSDRPMERLQEAAFAAVVDQRRGGDGAAAEREAFSVLARHIVAVSEARPVIPRSTLLEDQILWARSPVRLDLAGGWSDTPPFCLKHGGAVVNLAVDINGQAPVQAFVRVCARRHIVIRSIDLGAEKEITTVEELNDCAVVGGEFSLAKAALCLAGFHPRCRSDGAGTLAEILEAFGGGVEISLLAATPKGSGLGTSSVLAATLLAALSSTGGLGWDREEIVHRTLALEQMLSTGGGWQDQAGGIYHGIKLVETGPGFEQRPQVRWLPEELFGPDYANRRVLLYYTGITRVAKTILQEIVRGMFLNSAAHLRHLFAIRRHALQAYQAIQRESYNDVCRVVRRSWELNQRLDAGTCPPEIAALYARIARWTSAAKLLGAGGGGYLLIFAPDDAGAAAIRAELIERPPNAGARFVDFSVSRTGLQITRS